MEPGVGTVNIICLFAREDLEPLDLPLAAVGLLHGFIKDLRRCLPNFRTHTVPFHEEHHRMVGHAQLPVGTHGDPFTLSGRNQLLIGHGKGSEDSDVSG